MRSQYAQVCSRLKKIVASFESLSLKYKVRAVITRVSDKVKGDSGVHEDLRAVDIRGTFKGKSYYTKIQVFNILRDINKLYPRSDGYKTAIYHSYGDGPAHFHLQVSPPCPSLD